MKLLISFIAILVLAHADSPYPQNVTRLDLGDALKHSLGQYASYPLDTSQANNLSPVNGNCVENLGVLYQPNGGFSSDNPMGVWFTNRGQIAGLQVHVFGDGAGPQNLVNKGFWRVEGSKHWSLDVSFRQGNLICGNQTLEQTIGDRLVVNQGNPDVSYHVPLVDNEADSQGFQAGSCMAKMGQHWELDLQVGNNQMTWNSANLMPIVPMYHVVGPKKGQINAFFFTTPNCQDHGSGQWDDTKIMCGLPTAMMCQNWCNDDCTFDAWWFATNHVFFNSNPDSVKCESVVWIFYNPVLYAAGGNCPSNTPNPL